MNNLILVSLALVIGIATTFGIEYMRPMNDNVPMIIATYTFIMSVLAWLKAEQTHVSVNSQLAEWKNEVVGKAMAEGNIEGRKAEKKGH